MWKGYQKKLYISVSDSIYKNLSSQCNLPTEIEQVQENIIFVYFVTYLKSDKIFWPNKQKITYFNNQGVSFLHIVRFISISFR